MAATRAFKEAICLLVIVLVLIVGQRGLDVIVKVPYVWPKILCIILLLNMVMSSINL